MADGNCTIECVFASNDSVSPSLLADIHDIVRPSPHSFLRPHAFASSPSAVNTWLDRENVSRSCASTGICTPSSGIRIHEDTKTRLQHAPRLVSPLHDVGALARSSAPRSTTGTSSPDQLSRPLWASDLHAGATDPNVNTALYTKWNIFIHQNPTKAAAALRTAHRDRTPTKMDMNCIALTWVLISFLAELILSTPKHPISDLRVPRALLASDLADVYVDIITDPTFYREYPAYVRNIVHAMCAIVHGVGFIDALRDDARADRILDRAPLLWDVLWNNRNFVSAYDRTAFEGSDAMRGLISQVVYYYLKLYQSRYSRPPRPSCFADHARRKRVPHINATRLAHVALTCW
ncbi:hypothetical protein OF83DRAFT_1273282, partial [Amylostereum chailletii]